MHLENLCRSRKITKIRLTVYHKNRKTMQVYENQGFITIGPVTRDLGEGMITKDYFMEKELSS